MNSILNTEVRNAVEDVVDYLYADEKTSFEEMGDDDSPHIFHSVEKLSKFLAEPVVARPVWLCFVSYHFGRHFNRICYSMDEVKEFMAACVEGSDCVGEDESVDYGAIQSLGQNEDHYHEFTNSTWVTVTSSVVQ
jgi:hypothetical protein